MKDVIVFYRITKELGTKLLLEVFFCRRSCLIAIEPRCIITSQCAVFCVPSIVTIRPWQGKRQTIGGIIQRPTNNDIIIE